MAQQAERADQMQQLELLEKEAMIAKTKSDAAKNSADAEAQSLENQAVEAGLVRLAGA